MVMGSGVAAGGVSGAAGSEGEAGVGLEAGLEVCPPLPQAAIESTSIAANKRPSSFFVFIGKFLLLIVNENIMKYKPSACWETNYLRTSRYSW